MKKSITGLNRLCQDSTWQKKIKGNIAYLCHQASIDQHYNWGPALLQKKFGARLVALWGPQHGLVTNVQDNMVETQDFIHPYFKIPVHSLYSQTRSPTEKMLKNINTLIIDLQDVGTRVYTYIWTLSHIMEACANRDITVVILDRPNPINGITIEGNILEPAFSSFVGHFPFPMRHAMTIGEVAKYFQKYFSNRLNCNLEIIPMENWERAFYFDQTALPWVLPSPNLPSSESSLTFPATVLFEGTNISEGRGTTKSLEILGHPSIEPCSLVDRLEQELKNAKLEGQKLRPMYFQPMFQKHTGKSCGGFQIHVTDRNKFMPWKVGQSICKFLYHDLKSDFEWKSPPYEYEYKKLPIDLINGSDKIRLWIEKNGNIEELSSLEMVQMEEFKQKRSEILIY